MAKRTAQRGYLVRRINDLTQLGMTRGQIARATGIGERTQRKLISGETPGPKVFARQVASASKVPKGSREAGRVVVVVEDAQGRKGYVNMVLPEYARTKRLTPLDRARIGQSQNVREAVTAQLTAERKGIGSAPWTTDAATDARIVNVYAKGHTKQSSVPMVTL